MRILQTIECIGWGAYYGHYMNTLEYRTDSPKKKTKLSQKRSAKCK